MVSVAGKTPILWIIVMRCITDKGGLNMGDFLKKRNNYFATEINNGGQLVGVGSFGVYGDRNVDATFYY